MPLVQGQQPAPLFQPQPVSVAILKEVKDFQLTFLDKAQTYSKVVVGLGFGAFFTAWSGTKSHLSERALLGSVLPMTFALILYICFEMFQTMMISHLSLKFAKVDFGMDTAQTAFEEYKNAQNAWLKRLSFAWYIIFPLTAISGLVGAAVLIGAFVRAVLHI